MKMDELTGAIIVFLFGGATTVLSAQIPLGTFRMAGPGLFPICLGIILMALALIHVSLHLKAARQRNIPAPKQDFPNTFPVATKQMILFLVASLGAVLCIDIVGYTLSSFLLMFSLLRILGMKKWTPLLAWSLSTAVVSHLLFVQWLKIPLPKGWIGL